MEGDAAAAKEYGVEGDAVDVGEDGLAGLSMFKRNQNNPSLHITNRSNQSSDGCLFFFPCHTYSWIKASKSQLFFSHTIIRKKENLFWVQNWC